MAQGGICVLRDLSDYESYYQDTLKAGHYENNPAAVHTMIASSRTIINQLLTLGVPFAQENGTLCYTREGAHSAPRILYHQDQTGKAITGCLLEHAKQQLQYYDFRAYHAVGLTLSAKLLLWRNYTTGR